jgi:gliding motility-associated protein GldM
MAGGQLSARQRMINMMYLVLMALLALNVSKEILKSFHHMQVSFEESRGKLEKKINGQIGALKKQAASDPTLAGYLSRTEAADALIDDFIVYVETLEKEISHRVETEEGVPADAPAYMRDVEGSDNMEVHARYFVKDDNDGKEKKGFRGIEFKKKINDTRLALVALLQSDTSIKVDVEDGLAAGIESSSALRAYEGKINKKTWEVANLEHAPLGAVVALMARIKNDARATQSAVTDILAKGTASIIAVESFEAVVKTKSSAVMSGQEYKAEVFLAAKTKNAGNVEYKLTKGGSELVVDGDRASYTVTPSSQGTVEWGGYILMKTKKGVDTIPFNSEYQVFQGQASIAATKMNVLYIGVKNPISVGVPGVEPSSVQVRISGGGGKMSRDGRNYQATVTKTGKAFISVSATIDGKVRSVGKQEYKVRKLPTPIAKWGTIGSGLPTPKQAMLAQASLRASMGQGFAFDGVKYRVVSYQFIFAPKRGEARVVRASNAMITGAMKGIIRKARKGDRILVDKIRATGPGGTRTLLPIMIEIR